MPFLSKPIYYILPGSQSSFAKSTGLLCVGADYTPSLLTIQELSIQTNYVIIVCSLHT